MTATKLNWEATSDFRGIGFTTKRHVARVECGGMFVVRSSNAGGRWEAFRINADFTRTDIGKFRTVQEAKAAAVSAAA